MVMNEEEVREHCVKLAEECYRLTATVKDTDKALWDVNKMLEGAQIKEKELLDTIREIAEIIHYQMPLKYQDKWLAMMIERGLYETEEDEEKLAHNIDPKEVKIVSSKKSCRCSSVSQNKVCVCEGNQE